MTKKELEQKIKNIEIKIQKLDAIRLKLKGSVDHTELALKENKLNQTHNEQWVINTSFSLRDRKRKLKKLNVQRNNLQTEVGKLRKELRKEQKKIDDSTFERLFIINAKLILDKETYEKIRDTTLNDMKL